MFYFLWMCESGETAARGPTDVSEILARHPEAALQPLHPAWRQSHLGLNGVANGLNEHYHHWGKPLFGYYCSADRWVVAKHMQLLTNAGVDLLILDATNSVVYERVIDTILSVMDGLARQGRKLPKLAFYANTASDETVNNLYQRYYRSGARFSQAHWFRLDGKPLIIRQAGKASAEVNRHFTFRESQWPNEPVRDCGWPWIDFVRPQHLYSCRGRPEIMSVSVAQHAETTKMSSAPFEGDDKNWGRGYHRGLRDHSVDAISRGANFEQQWDEAIRRDPPFVFVTGWNEWIAARFNEGPTHFMVDLANAEFSRDIEMMEGGWGDAFYRQLFRNVRRYKGQPAPTTARCRRGDPGATFRDYRGDTLDRDAPGVGGARIVDRSGRNDIVQIGVACDDGQLQFRTETSETLRPGPGEWMRLSFAVRTGGASEPGLPFAVRFTGFGPALRAALYRRGAGDRWVLVKDRLSARQNDRQLEVAVPRGIVGASRRIEEISVRWSDNSGEQDDPMNVYRRGDAAPDGRLAYSVSIVR